MATKKPAVAEETDEEAGPEELEDLEDDDVLDLDEEDLEDGPGDVEDDDDVVIGEELDEDADEILLAEPATVVDRGAEAEEEDEDEEPDDEDVEASLDVILKERLVVEDEPEDEEPADVEDRSEATERVLPKQPDEFVCRSCFLVKHPSQLADKKRGLCRDCV